jgi:hypothetical protein
VRIDIGFEFEWLELQYPDRDPTITLDKNSQRHLSETVWINKRPKANIYLAGTP